MTSQENALNRTRRRLIAAAGAGVGALAVGADRLFASQAAQQSHETARMARSGISIASPVAQYSIMERSLSRAGAVGDGKTIDTDAIREAVAEVERNTKFETHGSNSPFLGVGELVWPQGLFLVDDAIRITRSLRLRGEGQAEYSSGARIQQQRPDTDLFRVEPIAQGCSIGFENMVLRANGGGGSKGALLRVVAASGQCNSIRIVGTVFATPQTYAIDIERGDDILISHCLFDVSATRCIKLGGPSPKNLVTNARIVDNNFYSVARTCVEIFNVDSVIIRGNNSFTETATRTFVQTPENTNIIKNVVVQANTLHKTDCLADMNAVDGLIVDANAGVDMGGGVDPRRALLCCSGNSSGVVITGNRMSGVGTLGFYDDTAGKIVEAVITGNAFTASSAKQPAIRASNTTGRIGDNQVSGMTQHGIGYRWTTANRSLSPGIIRPHAATIHRLPVLACMPGDFIEIQSRPDPLPDGIILTAHAVRDAIDIRYANITGQPVDIPSHDVAVLVTR